MNEEELKDLIARLDDKDLYFLIKEAASELEEREEYFRMQTAGK